MRVSSFSKIRRRLKTVDSNARISFLNVHDIEVSTGQTALIGALSPARAGIDPKVRRYLP